MEKKTLLSGLFVLILLIAVSSLVSAADPLYWVGVQNGNWSNANNWASSSGGAGGTGTPNSSYAVIFDSADLSNSVIDNNFSMFNLTISGYTGTISFTTNLSADLNITNHFLLGSGATIQPTYSSIIGNGTGRAITVGGNATILGRINGDGQGFPTAQGPGVNQFGAAHGGKGHSGGTVYGSVTQPTALGSGGWTNSNGGGAIKLNVSGDLAINGTISVQGSRSSAYGDGSAGSIWLIANSLSGTGMISANNTFSTKDIGASGGRIAIEYITSTFTGIIDVSGGGSSFGTKAPAQPGTLWEPNKFSNRNNYLINTSYNYYFPNQTNFVFNVTLTNNATIYFSNGTLNLTNVEIFNGSELRFDVNPAGSTGTNYNNMRFLSISNTLNINGSSSIALPAEGFYNLRVLEISNGSTLYAIGNSTAVNAPSGGTVSIPHGIGVTLNVNGNATILGRINADGQGFPGAQGPGVNQQGSGHGGLGGGSVVYGSVTQPTALGSGGYSSGYGGGAIKLNVTSNLTVTGVISAIGQDSSTWGEASGGSIWIIANSLSGDGILNVSSIGNERYGGGGRIAIEYVLSNFGGSIVTRGGGGTALPGTYFLCQTSYFGSCTTGYNGIVLNTNFSVNRNGVNITRNITSFSSLNVRWNDTSTNVTNIATYNITGLLVSKNYSLYRNTVFNSTLSTDSGTFLQLFNSTLNPSQVMELRGNAAPQFISVTQSPTSLDINLLDPGENVSITVNVSDSEGNFDSAILQWRNSTATSWTNITLANITPNGELNNIMNATFHLPNYEDNITYRIFVNDSEADGNFSSNYTINSSWDCTWLASSDIGQGTGFEENRFVGNMSVNNTGDSQHSSGCSLQFRTTYSLSEGRVYVDNSYFKPSNTFTLTAKANRTLIINATFLGEVTEESGYLTTSELLGISNSSAKNTTFTLVSTTGGPYLYQKATSAPTSLSLTFANFSLEGYVRNLVGNGSLVNDAHNVTFNWTLPSGFLVREGSHNISYLNISNSTILYNNINITFNESNLALLNPGTVSVYLYSKGYNRTAHSIVHSNNRTILSEVVNITLSCYNVSDGIAVSACGSLDGDYVAPPSSSSSSSSSGSSSSGTGAASAVFTKAEYQFTRGRGNTIILPLINKNNNNTLSNIQVEVSGDIAKYITVKPIYGSILPGKNATITLFVSSPTYLPLGIQNIVLEITGNLGNLTYTEQRVVAIQVNDITQDEAELIVNDIKELILELESLSFSSDYLQGLLAEMSNDLRVLDYAALQEKAAIIRKTAFDALEAKRIYDQLGELVGFAKEKEIDVSGTERLLKLTLLSLERQEFDQAIERAEEAQTSYVIETKGEFGSLIYYAKNNPRGISLAGVFLCLLTITIAKSMQLERIKRRIKCLKDEEIILTSLIKIVQKQTFKDKTLSMEEYEEAIKHYENRLAEVIQELISLETQRLHWLHFNSADRKLRIERERVTELIKDLQNNYMKKKNIETKSYELRLESYNKRISQIDEALANLEAQQELRKVRSIK